MADFDQEALAGSTISSSTVTRLMRPILSLILCSRNDQYMGNSRWRLETTLNYAGDLIEALGRSREVEVLVADWGSEVSLREAVALGPAAAKIVSFVTVPTALARELQRDSPFPEVLALNAAARRARGEYIGRIDQDTLVGERFLGRFFEWVEGRRSLEVPLETALLFANRRSIPYRFAVGCPALTHVKQFVRLFGPLLRVWRANPGCRDVFWTSYVGIWLAHRNLWDECGGYDERLIYYNWMETDMICRLGRKYPIVNLGKLTDYDFYHLDHHDPRMAWVARRHVVKNADMDLAAPPTHLHPNPETWGLSQYRLAVVAYSPPSSVAMPGALESGRRELWSFLGIVLSLPAGIVGDWLVIVWTAAHRAAIRRVRTARLALAGQPVTRWSNGLWKLWIGRKP